MIEHDCVTCGRHSMVRCSDCQESVCNAHSVVVEVKRQRRWDPSSRRLRLCRVCIIRYRARGLLRG